MNSIQKNTRRNAPLLPLLLFFFSIFSLCRLPAENILFPRPLNYKSHYENFYNSSLPHVTVTVPELSAAGLNYQRNALTQGTFYYTLYDGFCQFYLLPAGEDASSPVLTDQTLTGRLIQLNEAEYDELLTELAAALQWKKEALQKRTSPYIISALPGSVFFLECSRILSCIALIISALDLISYLKERFRKEQFLKNRFLKDSVPKDPL